MKIGILTSGGDCPGLNAVIRGVGVKGPTTDDHAVGGRRDRWGGVVGGSPVGRLLAWAPPARGLPCWRRGGGRPPPSAGQGAPAEPPPPAPPAAAA